MSDRYHTVRVMVSDNRRITLLVHRTAAQTIQVIDTLAAKPYLTDRTLLQIAAMYKPPTNSLSIDLVSVQQQKGVHNCGVFAIAFMVEICKGKGTPSGSVFSQKMMRLKICLEKGNISELPRLFAEEEFSSEKICSCHRGTVLHLSHA